jgi:6-pyruvoyltetrahydropterin/6-carboxytetrahydropterin synthase
MTDHFTYEISKRFEFAAAHQLRSLIGTTLADGSEHPCSRRHGHNYGVELLLKGKTLNEHGFLIDFNELSVFKEMLRTRFDHRDLNAELAIESPTAEVIARRLLRWAVLRWPEFGIAITVEETPSCKATVRFDHPDLDLDVDSAFVLDVNTALIILDTNAGAMTLDTPMGAIAAAKP